MRWVLSPTLTYRGIGGRSPGGKRIRKARDLKDEIYVPDIAQTNEKAMALAVDNDETAQ